MKISRYMCLSSGLRIIKIFNECKLNISYFIKSRFIMNLSAKGFLFNE